MICGSTDCVHCLEGECFKLEPEFINVDGRIVCIDYYKPKRIKHEEVVDDELLGRQVIK